MASRGPDVYPTFTGEQVAQAVQANNPGIDITEAHARLGLDSGGNYSLVNKYPVKSLPQDQEVDEDIVRKMAKIPGHQLPPIALDGDGRIRDGYHRTAAARMRGDKFVRAFVPIDDYTGKARIPKAGKRNH